MEELHLRFLGQMAITLGDTPVAGFVSAKAQALLCYLAVTGRAHSRQVLADLLWGEMAETTARVNLRKALSNLRRLLGDHLQITRHTAAFNRESPYRLDVEIFVAEVTEGLATGDISHLRTAVDLYRGDFLAGFAVRDAPAFEEWAIVERERLWNLAVQALERLADWYTAQGEYETSIKYIQQLLTLDPWREEAHRRKMLLLARSGQYSAALAQYETCRRTLRREFGIEPATETQRLRERILTARQMRRRPLPSQPAPFVGREEELTELGRLLRDPHYRLITLLGPGGIGKSRLALQAAEQNKHRFLHGIYFVPLASLPSPELLPSAILQALDVFSHGSAKLETQLLDYLQDKELLLILDGFEHLCPGHDLLVDILEQAPDVKLLVTSRERLRLRWEWPFAVGGLRYPDVSEEHPLPPSDALGPHWSAVQLFIQTARQAAPRFSPERNLPHIISICRSVEGMPLGIELAAAWVHQFPCRVIAREIARNLDFLRSPLQDVPSRHRSMRAAFDYSWNLLSPAEQKVFRRLAVFRGGFRQEAAEQIAGASAALLSALIAKSLLRRTAAERYEMPELLRQYAQEKLEQAGEVREIRRRHCEFYAAFLEEREFGLQGATPPEILEEVGNEVENVRLAWQWAVQEGDVKVLSQALGPLFLFYEFRGWFQEGEKAIRDALVPVRKSAERGDEQARRLLARLLIYLASFSRYLGDPQRGRALLEEGMALARRLGEWSAVALALNSLGILAGMRGDRVAERKFFRESLDIARSLNDRVRMAVELSNLASAECKAGNYEKSQRLSKQSASLCREIGHRRGLARAVQNLAIAAHLQNAYEEAERFYRESLDLFREIKDQWGVALTLGNLGDLAYRRGDYEKARQVLEESLVLRRKMHDRWGIALALNTLGGVARAEGNLWEAEQCFREALEIARQIHSHVMITEVLVEAAQLLAEKDKEKAIEVLAFALEHPATEERTREDAARILADLAADLPPEIASAARRRGKEGDLKRVTQLLVG